MADRIKQCLICGKSFSAYATQKYCSKECYNVSKIKYGSSNLTKKRKKTKGNTTLEEIANRAAKEGLTYGQYVTKYGL